MIETILSLCTYTLTTNNKRQFWGPILATVSVLNMYVVYDLNSLDTYTLCTAHEQDSVVMRHRGQTTCVLLLTCYTAHNVIHMCIARIQLGFCHKISKATILAHTCNC